MREIKFRGIDNANSDWIYGSLVKVDEDYHILEEGETQAHDYNRVDKDSIGQFTGLVSLKNEEIYEGDILKFSKDYILYVEWDDEHIFLV